jgi:hypothetical protein
MLPGTLGTATREPALSLASAIQTKSSGAKNGLEVRPTHLPDLKRKDFDDNQRLMGDFLESFPSKASKPASKPSAGECKPDLKPASLNKRSWYGMVWDSMGY